MWKLQVRFHNGTRNEYLCDSFDQGMSHLRTLIGRKSFRIIKLTP